MAQGTRRTVAVAVGALGVLAGLLVVIQIPAAKPRHRTTLAAAGVGVLLVLFGVKTLVETQS
ncbi:hypothetical protein [Halostella litorea]|uniref:hypothetical protein n=1 Tax=Halostella litorea TaxID=2528831 RepID=UPI0010921C78|nr:hypothetical protein [Halostella litorea]